MTGRPHPVLLAAGLAGGSLVLALALLALAVQLLAAAQTSASTCAPGLPSGGTPASATALREIPSRLIGLYHQAADAYRLGPDGWAWLAAVNRIETDFGRDLSTSTAGAIGWMQFEPATWAAYGVDANGDGRKDPYDPADAIAAAARYLSALGAPADWQAAIRGYNGGPGNSRSPATLAYWQSAVGSAAAYLGTGSAAAPMACVPCPAADPVQAPDTLAAYDPLAVPDARGGQGFTPRAGAVYTVAEEPQIARRLDVLGRALHLHVTGISGYRTPGPVAGDPQAEGRAARAGGLAGVPEGTLERFGLTRSAQGRIRLLGSGPTAGATGAANALPADRCAAGGAVPLAPGDRAQIQPDGRAAPPAGAPPAVRAMIAAGNQLIGKPYVYGGGHADFRLAGGYDCSSSVSWALHGAGFLAAPEDSSTLEGFGLPGAGLWVTVYANPGHTFAYVAGIRLDTSPQAGDGRLSAPGPRWRPATRSTVGFVARHPPGL